ncbi:MAG TPA: hypothetical protein VN366_13090 [Feifaniaceae bacterium]|nr:hypothetical protein [Feifaniaceae bacterium]
MKRHARGNPAAGFLYKVSALRAASRRTAPGTGAGRQDAFFYLQRHADGAVFNGPPRIVICPFLFLRADLTVSDIFLDKNRTLSDTPEKNEYFSFQKSTHMIRFVKITAIFPVFFIDSWVNLH